MAWLDRTVAISEKQDDTRVIHKKQEIVVCGLEGVGAALDRSYGRE